MNLSQYIKGPQDVILLLIVLFVLLAILVHRMGQGRKAEIASMPLEERAERVSNAALDQMRNDAAFNNRNLALLLLVYGAFGIAPAGLYLLLMAQFHVDRPFAAGVAGPFMIIGYAVGSLILARIFAAYEHRLGMLIGLLFFLIAIAVFWFNFNLFMGYLLAWANEQSNRAAHSFTFWAVTVFILALGITYGLARRGFFDRGTPAPQKPQAPPKRQKTAPRQNIDDAIRRNDIPAFDDFLVR